MPTSHTHSDDSPAARIALVLFLLLFIAGGIFFSIFSLGMGAPIFFAGVGIVFAIIGGLMLFSALTKKPRGMPRIDPDGPIKAEPKTPTASKCPGCGARRIRNAHFCDYCGSALV